MVHNFHGVWPALTTPFTAANEVNTDVLRALTQYLLAKKVDGFYVGGTTGEGVFMSLAERKLVIDTVLEEVNGQVPLIVHVGSTVAVDAVALARYAADAGVNGISSIIPPLYTSMESAVRYFTQLTAAVPDMPVFPYFLSQTIRPLDLMRELLNIPNIAGTKYTGPNMDELRQMIDLGGAEWTIFSGMDESCLFAAMMGTQGNIGSTLNFMPGPYKRIHELVAEGKLAEAHELQLKANRVTDVLVNYDIMGGLKAVMQMIGFDCGAPRLPRRALTPEELAAFKADLDQTDFAALIEM
jgi:N-acetylneuraminate lyase